MTDNSSITALISLFGRAYHAENDSAPIFNDTLSRSLMSDTEYKQIKEYMLNGVDFFKPDKKLLSSKDAVLKWIVQTHIAPTPLARARYCEDSLKTAMLTGTAQYVILGAGMDTFALRNARLLNLLRVFELDHPRTQEEKLRRLSLAKLDIPSGLSFVPIDFTCDSLAKKLFTYGYKSGVKAFFSCLGMTYYLTKGQLENMLDEIHTVAADGSAFLFDYADENLFDSKVKRVQDMLAMAAAGNEPMRSCFGYHEVERLLEKHDFLIFEHLNTQEIHERFFAGRTDYLTAFEHINLALAVLKPPPAHNASCSFYPSH